MALDFGLMNGKQSMVQRNLVYVKAMRAIRLSKDILKLAGTLNCGNLNVVNYCLEDHIFVQKSVGDSEI